MAPQASTQISAHAIRRRFLDFFVAKDHSEVPSAPLVPDNDPTLLFVNAGMVPFKDLFLGRETRDYRRATTSQRVIRAGGKHNDLDNVGFTPRHHTFFEMLGNFSFGDYFKPEAIEWAWLFLTQDLGIDPDRLCVSVYSGEGESAPADDEAYELWQKWIDKDRIYRCDAKDNFWSMGNTGPCGPCSEIHIARGNRPAPPDAQKGGPLGPSYEDDKYLELWNLVFMQYEKHDDGTLTNLPKPSIDTGAGLERLASVVAGVESNYETELLAPLVACAKHLAGVSGPQGERESAFQVIADHARATAFLITDGVFPDKGGRSYVLRRIMRRAIRYGTTVGLDDAFFHTVCLEVASRFCEAYPELNRARPIIEDVVRTEEENFRRTLSRGLKRMEGELAELAPEVKAFPVEVAAELYDTYGFPIDLSGVIAKERGLSLDETAVDAEVKRRQEGSENFVGQGQGVADYYFGCEEQCEGSQLFVGYESEAEDAKVVALLVGGQAVKEAAAGSEVEVLLDKTPFYAESGGQVGDAGVLRAEGMSVKINDTRKPTGRWHFHQGQVQSGILKIGQTLRAEVDHEKRAAIRRNHSATHMLHLALREVLGPQVIQKGSLVAADRLRFDFSHSKPLSFEERQRIEKRVAQMALGNQDSNTEEMTLDEAKDAGAIGLFGEKYGDRVRVVRIGGDSLELCGGTHVARAGDVGLFCITSEGGIAQGVRRIEAVTGAAALELHQSMARALADLSGDLHARDLADLQDKVHKIQGDLKSQSQQIAQLKQKLATGGAQDSAAPVEVGGIALLVKEIPEADAKVLRDAADTFRDRLKSGVVVLGSALEGKATLLVAATKDLKGKVHAGKLVAALAPMVGGRGGGKPELGQAGGQEVGGLKRALEEASRLLAEQLAES